MKVIRDIFRVLAIVFAAAVLVSFFVVPFAQLNVLDSAGQPADITVTGAQLSFGSDVSSNLGFETEVNIWKSGWYFISFFFSALTVLLAVLGLVKFRKANIGALIFGVLNAVLLGVLKFTGSPIKYIDYRSLTLVEGGAKTTLFLLLAFCASVAFLVFCVVGILIRDKIEVAESDGTKKTIIARLFRFLREYKSEIKKVVWPNGRTVVKNTIVVLAVCAVVLLLVWLVDLGMGGLFKLAFSNEASVVDAATEAAASVVS